VPDNRAERASVAGARTVMGHSVMLDFVTEAASTRVVRPGTLGASTASS
jgi:hypothetical protein